MFDRHVLPRPLRGFLGDAYHCVAPIFANSKRSKWLPLDSRVFGPPRRWSHTGEYCHARDFDWREVVAAAAVARKPPRCVNYASAAMLKLVAAELPAAGIARIRNARVVSPHGWVIAEDDTYLPDHSWHGYDVNACPIYNWYGLEATARLPGVTLNLVTDWSENYGHLLFDALPRVYLFEQAGYSWDDISHVLVPDMTSDGRRSAAELCGIPIDKMLPLSSFSVVECEELIVPTFPGVRCNSPRWVGEFWRSKSPPIPQQRRRIFLSRRGSRRTLTNESDLITVLEAFGFEIVVPSNAAIRNILPQAEIIVGAHGAALADVLFCNRDSVLVELTPPGHIEPYYYTAAESAGMSYFSILGTYPDDRHHDANLANFSILAKTLSDTLKEAEAALEEQRAEP